MLFRFVLVTILPILACGGSNHSKPAETQPEPTPVTRMIDAGPTTIPREEMPPVHLELKKKIRLSEEGWSDKVELLAYTIEQIEAPPHAKEPGGEAVVIDLTINGEDVQFGAVPGYEGPQVKFTSEFKLTLVGHSPDTSSADVRIERITDATAKILHESATIKRGEGLELEGQLRMNFSGFSHKMVYERQTSPLIVNLHYSEGEQELLRMGENLYPPESVSWRFRDLGFKMLGQGETEHSLIVEVRKLALESMSAQPTP